MKSLFLVSSAISTKFGVFSRKQRLEQTIETLKSIKTKIPESKILLIESSGESSINETEINQIKPYTESIFNFHDDKAIQEIYKSTNDNWDIVKNLTELTTYGKTLGFLLYKDNNILSDVNRVFKMSGRYVLNDHFDLNTHLNLPENYVFSERKPSQFNAELTNGLTFQFMTRLWSWPVSKMNMVYYRYNLMSEDFIGSINHKKYRDLEHLVLKYFDSPFTTEVPLIGVSGKLGPNGNEISD